jgi:hypothetical protein
MLRAIQYLAALLVVGFGLWIFGTSSSFQTCTTEQAAANPEQGQKNLPSFVLAGANRAAIYARCGGTSFTNTAILPLLSPPFL